MDVGACSARSNLSDRGVPGPCPKLVLAPFALLGLLLGGACDESSRPPAGEQPPAIEPQHETGTPEPEPAPSEPAPVEPTPPSGGPHCDQRQVADGEAKCIDYTEHTGPVAPRCFADDPLGEGPCPSEGVIGKCKLPATGVTLVYYAGTTADAAKQICATIDGVFTQG
jgi:hypothetical protein